MIKGGFGLVLDGTKEAAERLKMMIFSMGCVKEYYRIYLAVSLSTLYRTDT